MNIRRKYIAEIACRLLKQAGITRPPVNVIQVAQLQNAIVCPKPAEDKYAGYLFRDAPGGIAVIGVNSKHSDTRQRFTIAHEIGHLVLHTPTLGEPVHFDEIFMRRDLRSAAGTDPKEIEANLFAAELLMPAHMIADDLKTIAAEHCSEEKLIEWMADDYQVSAQAMGIRLSNLGYL